VAIDFSQMRERLQQFDFPRLFVDELGWSKPSTRDSVEMTIKNAKFTRRQISHLAGVAVFEISAGDGRIPDAKTRAAIDKDVSSLFHEHLLIFVDKERTQSLWYWVKRQDGKTFPRDHFYLKGQPGDLFLSKLGGIVFEITEFDRSGNVPVFEVAQKLRGALDVERVTKKFYGEFYDEHIAFIEHIRGIPNEKDRRWYASVLLNRLMFVYFLQRKRFIDNGNLDYLQNKLVQSRARGRDLFYSEFLKLLFFEGFAKPEERRSAEARHLLGSIKYLNGGLFLPHRVGQDYPDIHVPDKAFENILALFQRYSWNLNDTPGGLDNEISPDVLGYIFEKYINQKAFGAYYTRSEITEYLCGQTVHKLVLNAINTPEVAKANPIRGVKTRDYRTIAEVLMDLDGPLCRELLFEVLPNITLLDPACGSGAFLVAAMKVLINVYAAVIGKIKFLNQKDLTTWLDKTEREHRSLSYFIKKRIITDNLYGVDIMEEATEIARLRLFLALVASASDIDQLEPLPNIDFNILPGNSLIGLMRVKDEDFERLHAQASLFRRSYRELLNEKNRLIDSYRHSATFTQDLTALRDEIDATKAKALSTLDDILLEEFRKLEIKFEESTWDMEKNREGRPVKRSLRASDIAELHPFHWGYEFDRIMNERGGFDAIITNPPWETFQPDAKEFFAEYSDAVTKKTMGIKQFDLELKRLLTNARTKKAWLDYHSRFNHLRHFFRVADQYKNQVPIIDGKRHGKDVNLFKLFLEQCFNLLRDGGECGIVIPSGIYTDLGAKQLRELLFSSTEVTGLFCFENRKEIFEGVHRSFKFVVLTFQKAGRTIQFPAAFMRHDVSELSRFPDQGAVDISVDLVRRLAPDSLSVMEFKSELDVHIASKMLRFPLLSEAVEGAWQIELHREFNMTDDAHLFHESWKPGMLPLFEGKMIWQFDDRFSEPRYWIDEKTARSELLSTRLKRINKALEKCGGAAVVDESKVKLDYEHFRLGYRDIAASTNERAMICTVLPRRVFAGNTLNLQRPLVDVVEGQQWHQEPQASLQEMLFAVALFNSFTVDWMIRNKITSHLNMFYVYQLPIPRLTDADSSFVAIVERAARLICTRKEFDDLAKSIGLGNHKAGATDELERFRLRAELDGLAAHVYGLTEEEFAHILATFPLVPDPVRVAAQNAYRDVERGLIK
jgi:Eco57I restriction-modification methylase